MEGGVFQASSTALITGSTTMASLLNVNGALNLASTFTCSACVTASDVSLANLTATDSTLTFSGTYNGSTARTIGLALGTANTWTSATTTFQSGIVVSSVNGSLGIGTSTFNGKLVIDGGQAYVGEFRIPSSATPAINWNNGNQQIMTMTANVTAITMTGGYNGGNYKLELCQDGTGNRTATGWGAGIIFFVGDQTNATSSPGMTTGPGTCNIMTLNRSGGTSTPIYQGTLFIKGK